MLCSPQAGTYVWPLNNGFTLNNVRRRLLWTVKTNSEAHIKFYFQTFSFLYPFMGV
jgi:hypothetical protein